MDETIDRTAGHPDRRAFLKRAAATGVVAWSAPVVLAQPANAETPVCTPAGLPTVEQGTVQAFIDCTGNGRNRTVTFRLEVPRPQVTCPLGGEATVVLVSCTSDVGECQLNADGSATWTYPGSRSVTEVRLSRVLRITCGECTSTCTTNVTATFSLQDNGNCRGTSTVTSAATNCAAG